MDSDCEKVLVVIDMQNDFIDGALGTPEAQSIVERVCSKIVNWEGEIYLTRDVHDVEYLSTPEGKLIPVPHCLCDDHGSNICTDVVTSLGLRQTKSSTALQAIIFPKSTFGSVVWPTVWPNCSDTIPKEVEICGLCTDLCVLANAITIQATVPKAKIVVDASCCAGSTPEMHRKAIEMMEHLGIEVINKS